MSYADNDEDGDYPSEEEEVYRRPRKSKQPQFRLPEVYDPEFRQPEVLPPDFRRPIVNNDDDNKSPEPVFRRPFEVLEDDDSDRDDLATHMIYRPSEAERIGQFTDLTITLEKIGFGVPSGYGNWEDVRRAFRSSDNTIKQQATDLLRQLVCPEPRRR